MEVDVLVKLSHLDKSEQVAISRWWWWQWWCWWTAEVTYKIAGAVCAPTANTLPVVHVIVEAHWIDF